MWSRFWFTGPSYQTTKIITASSNEFTEGGDAVDLNKTQEVDAGYENDAEVEVEDDTIASPDEVAIGENAEGALVEEVANAAELDNISEDNPAAEEDTEEDADDR